MIDPDMRNAIFKLHAEGTKASDNDVSTPASNLIGTQIGPFKIREQIGEGGMGAVYVAEQTEPVKRKVALKLIRSGLAGSDVVGRFEAERQALALMNHPNIARVLDGGTTESGQPYFAMELVQGLPITEYCDERKLTTHSAIALHHCRQLAVWPAAPFQRDGSLLRHSTRSEWLSFFKASLVPGLVIMKMHSTTTRSR